MTERETLLMLIAQHKAEAECHEDQAREERAGLAKAQARLAELDKEPDYDALTDLIAIAKADDLDDAELGNWVRVYVGALEEALSAALAKAPSTGSGIGEAEIEELARECVHACTTYPSKGMLRVSPQEVADYAIRETLSRVQPRWPSDTELREMAASVREWCYDNKNEGTFDKAALEMARRIREYQTGGAK